MMIDVKGTKTAATTRDPAQAYALQEPGRASMTPHVLTMVFIAVGLFIKSVFPGFAKVREAEPGQPNPEEAAAFPVALAMTAGDGTDPQAQQPSIPTIDPDQKVVGSALSGPWGGLPVIRLTDISYQWGNFELESPEVMIWPDTRGMLAFSHMANGATFGGRLKAVTSSSSDPVAQVLTRSEATDDPAQALPPGTTVPTSPPPVIEAGAPPPGGGGQTGPNRAPRVAGPVYLQDVTGGAILLIGLLDLLRNASDPDGDAMFVVDVKVSSGSLTEADGGWAYQATGDFTQPVVVSYSITDGEFVVPQTAHFTAIRPWIEGTCEDDLLVGTIWADDIIGHAGDDNIDGRAGDDVIAGGDGDDHILGGDGDDTIFGGRGDDILFGQAGNDHLFGGDGDDRIYGGDGDDLLFGEAGDDQLFGDAGNDLLYGAAGNDLLHGGTGDDQLFGGAGHDVLFGGAGDDKLFGEAGNDVLHDGAGRDEVYGGDGDDHVIAAADAEDDQFHGGDGFDTLDYSQTVAGITIDLNAGIASGDEIGTDVFTGFEMAIGGAGDDHFIVGQEAAVLVGGEGENTFEFLPATVTENPNLVIHQILDFKYGDQVKMSNFKLFEKVYDKLEDEFEAMYGKGIDEDDIPIRVRYDTFDEVRRTIIEADFDNNDTFETTIYIQGHHALVMTDMTA